MPSNEPPQSGKPEAGPPNLDELFVNFIKKLTGTTKLQPNLGSGSTDSANFIIVGFLFLLIILLWMLSGIFVVSPAERAVVLRFGRYMEILEPGLHWIPRFIEESIVVNVQRIGTFSYKSEMLTKDENIVFVSLSVQYRIDDPRAFLFNVVNPIASLQQATASALRQVVGHTALDDILTTGRAQVREEVAEQLNTILEPYHTGLVVMDVALQPAQPPEQVTAAFDDAINAREDEQRYINQAQTYAEKVIPVAQGQAARIYQAALADKEKIILQAQGAVAGYLSLLPAYEKAPEVTRKRLYLDTMEFILNKTSKVISDNKANDLIYLPLDKILSSTTAVDTKLDHQACSSCRLPRGSGDLSNRASIQQIPTSAGKTNGDSSNSAKPDSLSTDGIFSDRQSYADDTLDPNAKKGAAP